MSFDTNGDGNEHGMDWMCCRVEGMGRGTVSL
jgi:hypothetical protein